MKMRPLLAALLLATAMPVAAADPPPLDKRVDKVERELRAVQRKVFPAGTPAFTEPEIAPAPEAATVGSPAGQPLAELGARVDGLERELARLTGQVEQVEHRLTLTAQQAAADRAEFDARLKALEARGVAPAALPAATDPVALPPPADSPFRTLPTTRGPARAAAPAPVPPPAAVDAGSADPAEAAYLAGYRLWADKKYGEAEDALGKVATQYPKHRRASYARNLQGRAYLDDGQPAEAARTLYANYRTDPRGERAPESLFYLGDALTRLKKYDDACKAYGELTTVYAATLGDTLRARLPAGRQAARCGDAGATGDADDARPGAKPAKAPAKPAAGSAKKPK